MNYTAIYVRLMNIKAYVHTIIKDVSSVLDCDFYGCNAIIPMPYLENNPQRFVDCHTKNYYISIIVWSYRVSTCEEPIENMYCGINYIFPDLNELETKEN